LLISQRKELIETLRSKGISSDLVLEAIKNINREDFIPDIMKIHAWEDVPLPIGNGQTISQPYTVAFMTSLLEVKKNDKILEIGTGSGYQAALLNYLGAQVYSIERSMELYNSFLKLMDKLQLRIMVRLGDGTIGWNDFAPYDKIIVTAGSPTIPKSYFSQLKVGGKLVIPIGDRFQQEMQVVEKLTESDYKIESYPNFKFVPLVGVDGWKSE